MKISELADCLGYEYTGISDVRIRSLAYAREAGEDDLAIVRSAAEIQVTRAKAVLTEPRIVRTAKTLVFCTDSLELAAVRAARVLVQGGISPDYDAPVVYSSLPNSCMAGKNFCVGAGTAMNPFCVIGDNVKIGRDCIIGPQVWIGSGVEIGDHVTIRAGTKLGGPALYLYMDNGNLISFPGIGTVRIGNGVEIGCNCVIQRGTFSDTVIGNHTILGDLVNVGHDVHIGHSCRIISQVGIAGNAELGNHVQIFGQAGVANGIKIGDRATVLGKTSVTKNVGEGKTILGLHGRERSEELRLQVKLRRLQEV